MSLLRRTITACITVPLIIFCVLFNGEINLLNLKINFFDIFIFTVIFLGIFEINHLVKNINKNNFGSGFIFLSLIIPLIAIWSKKEYFIFNSFKLYSSGVILFLIFIFSIYIVISIIKQNIGSIFASAGTMISGIIFLPIIISIYILIRKINNSANFILFVFVISWVTDIGAYMFGSLFGKRPLCKKISPNKTVEGTLSGIVTAIIVSVIFSLTGFIKITIVSALIYGIIFSVWGQLGDLTESIMKREAGVKDSGGLLPGHGGILDALDSTIFNSIPLLIIVIIKGGIF